MRQIEPDGFPDTAFEAVANDGFTKRPRCSETDSGAGLSTVGKAKGSEKGTRKARPLVINFSEVAVAKQPYTFGKAFGFWRTGSQKNAGIRLALRTYGQFLAAHSPTAGKHSLAVSGLHAGPKSVHFGAATVIRLESTFRHYLLFLIGVGNFKHTLFRTVPCPKRPIAMIAGRFVTSEMRLPQLPPTTRIAICFEVLGRAGASADFVAVESSFSACMPSCCDDETTRALWLQEIVNVLAVTVTRSRITPDRARKFLTPGLITVLPRALSRLPVQASKAIASRMASARAISVCAVLMNNSWRAPFASAMHFQPF